MVLRLKALTRGWHMNIGRKTRIGPYIYYGITVLSMLLGSLVLWSILINPLYCKIRVNSTAWIVIYGDGTILYQNGAKPGVDRFHIGEEIFTFMPSEPAILDFKMGEDKWGHRYINLPMFWILILFWTFPVGWFVRDWMKEDHQKSNLCANCSYDLRASPGPTCPDCGVIIPSKVIPAEDSTHS